MSTLRANRLMSLDGSAAVDISSLIRLDNLSQLRSYSRFFGSRINVDGAVAAGDGGGGLYQYDASDSVTPDDGGSVIVASDGGRWKLRQNTPICANQFESVAKAMASAVRELWITQDMTVSANQTWPAGKTYTVMNNATITVSPGITLTIRGKLNAPVRRIFQGNGSVIGLRYARPEWWGAVGDNNTDCAAAFNSASACVAGSVASDSVRPTIEIGPGQFLMGATWLVNASANVGIEIFGQGSIFSGTRLVAASTFSGSQLMYIPGSTDGTQKIVDIRMRDFGLVPRTPGSGPSIGLQMGTTNAELIGLRESPIQDLYIANFGRSLYLCNTRLLNFARIGIWNDGMTSASACLFIEAAGRFCGDMSFRNCQLTNQATVVNSRDISLSVNAPFSGSTGYNQLAGIRFTECVLYPAYQSVYGTALAGGLMTDLFFQNCQWDGDSYEMMNLIASGSGSLVRCIKVNGCYMFGGNKSNTNSQLEFNGTASGAVRDVTVTGTTIGQGASRAINLAGTVVGATLTSNVIYDFGNPTNAAIEVGPSCSRVTVTSNRADRSGGASFPYLIQLDNGADFLMVTGNTGLGIVSSATVQDNSTTTNKVVANNL